MVSELATFTSIDTLVYFVPRGRTVHFTVSFDVTTCTTFLTWATNCSSNASFPNVLPTTLNVKSDGNESMAFNMLPFCCSVSAPESTGSFPTKQDGAATHHVSTKRNKAPEPTQPNTSKNWHNLQRFPLKRSPIKALGRNTS
jgi:hypothetical protein